jgi:hypothetical protein
MERGARPPGTRLLLQGVTSRSMKWLVPMVLVLAGCGSHTAWQVSAGNPQPGATVHVDGGRSLATIFGLTILAATAYEAARTDLEFDGGSYRGVPDMAPERRVSEQDCTKPLDYSLGNIRCK